MLRHVVGPQSGARNLPLEPFRPEPNKILIMGWNHKICTMLHTLESTVLPGSTVDIYSPRPADRTLGHIGVHPCLIDGVKTWRQVTNVAHRICFTDEEVMNPSTSMTWRENHVRALMLNILVGNTVHVLACDP